MRKFYVFLFVVAVLLSTSALGDLADIDFKPIHLYPLSNASDIEIYHEDFLETGDPDYTVDGKIGKAVQLDGGDDTLKTAALTGEENATVVNFWVRHDTISVGNGYPVIRMRDGADTDQLKINTRGGSQDTMWYRATLTSDGGNFRWALDSPPGTAGSTGFSMVTVMRNTSHACMAINETIVACVTDLTPYDSDMDQLFLSTDGGNIEPQSFDNFYMGQEIVNRSWLDAVYNNGSGINFTLQMQDPAGASPINLSEAFPLDNTQYSAGTISINATVNSTASLNASLYLNGTWNRSVQVAAGQLNKILFNVTLQDGAYTYFINATINISDYRKSATNTFFVDTVAPTIAYTLPASTNDSLIYGTLNSNVTLSDDNLYSYDYNITHLNGSVISSFSSNTSLAGHMTYQLNHSVNLGAFTGELRAVTLVCDSHTAKSIRYNNIRNTDKELFFEGVKIYQDSKAKTQSANYKYKGDRYSFEFRTNQASKTESFFVESPDNIEIVQNSRYKGHLVTGGKWVDFEDSDVKNVIITRISAKKVRVTVTRTANTKNWNFNSIGDLNCVKQSASFYAMNTTETFTTPVLGGQVTQHILNISYDPSFMGKVTGTLYWNNTAYPAVSVNHSGSYLLTANITPQLNVPTNITFNWVFRTNGINYNTSSKTQEVQVPGIDMCTSYSTRWVNYTLYDELSGANISGDVTFLFTYTGGGSNNTFGGTSTGSGFTFCMTPSTGNFTSDVIIQYGKAGYANRTYYAEDYVVDPHMNNISLYLLSAGSVVDITIHLVDGSDVNLADYLVEAYRYDVATDSDILVQTEKTDSNGNAILGLTQGQTQYSFKMYDVDGNLVLTTKRFKLFDTSYEFVIQDSVANPLSEKLHLASNVERRLAYDNDTNLVNFTWAYSGSQISEFCLKIVGNDTTWYDTCSDSMGSSLSYTITTFNVSYVAYGQAKMKSGSTHNLEVLGIDTRISVIDIITAGTALMIVFIVFLFVSLIGIINKSVAVAMGIASILFLWLFGLLPIGIVGVTGIVVIGIITLMVLNKT